MPLITGGTLVDQQIVSVGGTTEAGAGQVINTYAHSLPATNPETVLVQLISAANTSGSAIPGQHLPLALGGNASLLTVGFNSGGASTTTIPASTFRITAVVHYSTMR